MSLFERIPEEKQRAVLQAAMEEFAEQGYEAASTNAIVKRLGIAKGSLFKYFPSKERLFRTVIDHATKRTAERFPKDDSAMPRSIRERILDIARRELRLYVELPLTYRFFRSVLADDRSTVVESIRKEMQADSIDFFRALTEDAVFPAGYSANDITRLRDVIEWTLLGLGKRWFSTMESKDRADESLHARYLEEVNRYMELIVPETHRARSNYET